MTTSFEPFREQAIKVADLALRVFSEDWPGAEAGRNLEMSLYEFEQTARLVEDVGQWDCDDRRLPEASRGIEWRKQVSAWVLEIKRLVQSLAQLAQEKRSYFCRRSPDGWWKAASRKRETERDKLSLACERLSGLVQFAVRVAAPHPAEQTAGMQSEATQPPPQSRKKQKRSTEPGEARRKLIAALTAHHRYADGSCLNSAPVGNNQLVCRQSSIDG
jgi:hypothetical protein